MKGWKAGGGGVGGWQGLARKREGRGLALSLYVPKVQRSLLASTLRTWDRLVASFWAQSLHPFPLAWQILNIIAISGVDSPVLLFGNHRGDSHHSSPGNHCQELEFCLLGTLGEWLWWGLGKPKVARCLLSSSPIHFLFWELT
jgi:hypothetical protein